MEGNQLICKNTIRIFLNQKDNSSYVTYRVNMMTPQAHLGYQIVGINTKLKPYFSI